MIKKLFTIEELRMYGFVQVREGGYTYMQCDEPDKPTLVSVDFEDNGENLPDEEFTRVFALPDLATQLSQKDIEDIIYGGGK